MPKPICYGENGPRPMAIPDSFTPQEKLLIDWNARSQSVLAWEKTQCMHCGRRVWRLIHVYDGHILDVRTPPHKRKD